MADKLSTSNKLELERLNIFWVELNQAVGDGYKRFSMVLEQLGIPYTLPEGDISEKLNAILEPQNELTSPDLIEDFEGESE